MIFVYIVMHFYDNPSVFLFVPTMIVKPEISDVAVTPRENQLINHTKLCLFVCFLCKNSECFL